MAYLVLARRWRPQRFEDVIGQHHITHTLQNAIKADRVAHAYVFSGARGVGKTTVARILAKALNCQEGPTPHPCGTCDFCREVAEGISLDVQEIDGASNTGVDDVRSLREGLRYRTAKGRYRIYIIDEVHMLSNQAFNALLKTLEEPPPHVIFIFATTEPHKIPLTILSRCQRFDFRRIPLLEIEAQLGRMSQEEGIQVDGEVLTLIAKEAQGSLRDAQSLLDQVISYAGTHIRVEAVQEVLGILDRHWLFRTSEALIGRNARACLDLVEELFQHGHSLVYFYGQLVEHLRNLMVARVDAEAMGVLHLPDHEVAQLSQQAGQVSLEDLQVWFDILVGAEEGMRRSPYPRYLLEMLLVKLAALDRTRDLEALLNQVRAIREGGSSSPAGAPPSGEATVPTPSAPPETQKGAVSEQGWADFLQHVRQQRPALASILDQGRYLQCSEKRGFRIAFPTAFHVESVSEGEQARALETLCRAFFGRTVKVLAVLDAQAPQCRENHARLQHHQAQVSVKAHPVVQEVLQLFGGRVVEVRLPEETSGSDAN
jgi:DNA polymerase-3 subunit gamma/tau